MSRQWSCAAKRQNERPGGQDEACACAGSAKSPEGGDEEMSQIQVQVERPPELFDADIGGASRPVKAS